MVAYTLTCIVIVISLIKWCNYKLNQLEAQGLHDSSSGKHIDLQ